MPPGDKGDLVSERELVLEERGRRRRVCSCERCEREKDERNLNLPSGECLRAAATPIGPYVGCIPVLDW